MTDPYAVVPAQRAPQPPPPPRPTGQIGGRAMLSSDESLTERIAQTSAGPYGAPDAYPQQPQHSGGGRRRAPEPPGTPWARSEPASPTAAAQQAQPWDRPTGAAPARAAGLAGTAAGALASARRLGTHAVTSVRGWPRNVQFAAAAGVAVVLLTGVVFLATGGDDEPPARPPVAQGAAPQQPAIEVQRYADRGLSVNVPKGWKPSGAGVYVDYTDPADAQRKVRILVEKASASAQPVKFLNAAGDRLDRTPRSCEAPYREIGLREVEQAGLPSAELEYTCGEGDEMSHGLWRAVITDGRAYSFRLTTPEARFDESKGVFEEMVRSFRLDAA
jgi:hypothetical protein